MGTNYYLYENICPHCGRSDDPLHIGKSSAGWCFSLHAIPEKGLLNLSDWMIRWNLKGSEIRDERGTRIDHVDFLRIIIERSWNGRKRSIGGDADWYTVNYAEPGPNGLARHKIMFPPTNGCIGHGSGTWDLIAGEFS